MKVTKQEYAKSLVSILPISQEENINYVQYFETPDRIIYKEKDNYYVFTSAKQDYTDIMN